MALHYVSDVTSTWYAALQDSMAEPKSRPMPLLLATAAGSLGAYLAYGYYKNRDRKLPPSPRCWPIIGNALELSGTTIHKDFLRVQKKYDLPDVFTLYLGPGNKMIILNSYDAIKDAFVTQGKMFAFRTNSLMLKAMGLNDVTDGEFFVQQKPFFASALRNVGFGSNKTSEEKILAQFDLLMDYLQPQIKSNEPIDIDTVMFKFCANVIFDILLSRNYSLDDAELQNRIDFFRAWYAELMKSYTMDMMSETMVNLFMSGAKKRLRKATDDCMDYMWRELEEHKKSLDPEQPRDFMDIMLTKRDESVFTDSKLVGMTFLFLPDALDSISSFISWVILYVTDKPDVQRRMQKELDDVIGGRHHIEWSDKPKFPYTEAVFMEVIRHCCPVSITGLHCNEKDSYFRGYYFPKGTSVMANLFAALNDPKHFVEPEKFNPERFLDEDGKVTKRDLWIPFGMGARKCMGEQLAKIEVLLFVANLYCRYETSFPENEPKPTITGRVDLASMRPEKFKILLKPRK